MYTEVNIKRRERYRGYVVRVLRNKKVNYHPDMYIERMKKKVKPDVTGIS